MAFSTSQLNESIFIKSFFYQLFFLIFEETFENFLKRSSGCLKEKGNEIFKDNLMNCLRKTFY